MLRTGKIKQLEDSSGITRLRQLRRDLDRLSPGNRLNYLGDLSDEDLWLLCRGISPELEAKIASLSDADLRKVVNGNFKSLGISG